MTTGQAKSFQSRGKTLGTGFDARVLDIQLKLSGKQSMNFWRQGGFDRLSEQRQLN